MGGVLDCGNHGEGNFRGGFEAGAIGRRQGSCECSAELGAELERIERIENALRREEFGGASGVFGTEHRNAGENRFAGNEARKAAGLPVLSPAQYLSTEESFDQIMKASGLPSGFYDSKGDFANWIGKNISPTEIQSRVDMATQATILSNPDYRKALNQMGIDNAHLTAYFLDTDKALPYLQKAAATAQIGAEALHQNLAFDQAYADKLATEGITAQQAASGYQQIAGELDTMKALGSMYGENWTQRTSEQAAFEGNAGATAEKGRLMSRERAAFGGATGGARGGLGQEGGAR